VLVIELALCATTGKVTADTFAGDNYCQRTETSWGFVKQTPTALKPCRKRPPADAAA
jgi:hypothetical protein